MATNFTSYEHMENHYNLRGCDGVNPTIQFVCTEKIHGTNYSFLVNSDHGLLTPFQSEGDSITVIPCKRTSILKENDLFFNHQRIFDKYKDEAVKVFNEIKLEYPDVKNVQLFGELFGGFYDGVTETGHKKIQKGVNYHKENEFMAYDLKIKTNDSDFYYDFDKLHELLKKTNIKLVPVIFTGSLHECLKLNPAFVSQVYSYFGLEKIDDSKLVSEGYVIHPIKESQIQFRGGRCIFKFKNPIFIERSEESSPVGGKDASKGETNKSLVITYNLLRSYMTQNRYDNVVSKLSDSEKTKEKISSMLYDDILTDLKADFSKEVVEEENKKKCEKLLKIIIEQQLKVFAE